MQPQAMGKVAFICLGNSCRSIMAEALARHFYGAVLDPVSAGISPLGFVARETIQVLAEVGADTRGLRSKGLEEIDFQDCRLIVNLTDYSLEALLPAAARGKVVNRQVADPYGGGLDLYRQSRDAIRALLVMELGQALDWPEV
jgi:arsenate reductase